MPPTARIALQNWIPICAETTERIPATPPLGGRFDEGPDQAISRSRDFAPQAYDRPLCARYELGCRQGDGAIAFGHSTRIRDARGARYWRRAVRATAQVGRR